MAHLGPATYVLRSPFDPTEVKHCLGTSFSQGPKDRFFREGHMSVTEAQANPKLMPACYDVDCYWKAGQCRKTDQGARTGSLTHVPDSDEGKYPLSIAELETRRLLASRPGLDPESNNWGK